MGIPTKTRKRNNQVTDPLKRRKNVTLYAVTSTENDFGEVETVVIKLFCYGVDIQRGESYRASVSGIIQSNDIFMTLDTRASKVIDPENPTILKRFINPQGYSALPTDKVGNYYTVVPESKSDGTYVYDGIVEDDLNDPTGIENTTQFMRYEMTAVNEVPDTNGAVLRITMKQE